MKANLYRSRWAQWLPRALEALAKNPPDYKAVMPDMPLPDTEPVPFAKPPTTLRMALLTSSGAYDVRAQAPFDASSIVGDPTHRVLDTWMPEVAIEFAHEHFDHSAAKADLECIVPRNTATECGIELAPHIISWTGFSLDWPTFMEATIPQIVKRLERDGANGAVLVPI